VQLAFEAPRIAVTLRGCEKIGQVRIDRRWPRGALGTEVGEERCHHRRIEL